MQRPLSLNAVIVHEDFNAAIRAQDLAQRLAGELGTEFELTKEVWGFELLSHPQLRQEAAAGAAEADVVIVSVGGAAELPAHVRTWIQSWTGDKRVPAALVALIDAKNIARNRLPSLCAALQQAAKGAGMDYFCNAEGRQPPIAAPAVPVPEIQPAIFEQAAGEPVAGIGWGIND